MCHISSSLKSGRVVPGLLPLLCWSSFSSFFMFPSSSLTFIEDPLSPSLVSVEMPLVIPLSFFLHQASTSHLQVLLPFFKDQAMAHATLLHVHLHSPNEFDTNLWLFAMDCTVCICNHLPASIKDGWCPEEIFSGMILGASPLQHLKAFGSPVCVLDPQLQDGKKIPKWQPRLHLGQFLGFSKEHSSAVGLIKNVKTGCAHRQ